MLNFLGNEGGRPVNTARLARKSVDARGDFGKIAEALGEEIDDPAAGLVTRDHLDKRFAEFEAGFTWKIIGLFGVQIVIFLLITKYL
jgi:hypothetical protein